MQCFVVFVVSVIGLSAAQDQCVPTKQMGPHVHHGDCCNVTALAPFASMFMSATCAKKYPRPPRPATRPTTPDPAFKRHQMCYKECVFTENALLAADLKLNSTAVTAKFVTTDSTLSPVMAAAVTTCLASYAKMIDPTIECKSGAGEFSKCLTREVFNACPATLWTASTECEALKTKTASCPTLPIKLWHRGGRGGGGGGRGGMMG